MSVVHSCTCRGAPVWRGALHKSPRKLHKGNTSKHNRILSTWTWSFIFKHHESPDHVVRPWEIGSCAEKLCANHTPNTLLSTLLRPTSNSISLSVTVLPVQKRYWQRQISVYLQGSAHSSFELDLKNTEWMNTCYSYTNKINLQNAEKCMYLHAYDWAEKHFFVCWMH